MATEAQIQSFMKALTPLIEKMVREHLGNQKSKDNDSEEDSQRSIPMFLGKGKEPVKEDNPTSSSLLTAYIIKDYSEKIHTIMGPFDKAPFDSFKKEVIDKKPLKSFTPKYGLSYMI